MRLAPSSPSGHGAHPIFRIRRRARRTPARLGVKGSHRLMSLDSAILSGTIQMPSRECLASIGPARRPAIAWCLPDTGQSSGKRSGKRACAQRLLAERHCTAEPAPPPPAALAGSPLYHRARPAASSSLSSVPLYPPLSLTTYLDRRWQRFTTIAWCHRCLKARNRRNRAWRAFTDKADAQSGQYCFAAVIARDPRWPARRTRNQAVLDALAEHRGARLGFGKHGACRIEPRLKPIIQWLASFSTMPVASCSLESLFAETSSQVQCAHPQKASGGL